MSSDAQHWAVRLTLIGLFAFFCLGLSSFGMWDPWELGVADAAQAWLDGETASADHVSAITQLVAASFQVFGANEWSGRLPFAISAWLCCLFSFLLVQTTLGRRAGWLAAIVLATSPLLLLNARHMVGAAPHFAAQAAVAYFGVRIALWPATERVAMPGIGLVLAIAFSVWLSGAMAGPLPPMAAIAITALMFRERLPVPTRARAVALGVLVLGSSVMVAFAVAKDGMHYSPWLGGFPSGGEPPAFDSLIERVFHGFSPWSALLIAGAMNWAGRRNADDARAITVCFSLLWAAFGYVAATVFLSRYGDTTFYPVAALAILAATVLDDLADDRRARWPTALIFLLILGLIVRDFALYPGSPVTGLPLSDLALPDGFNPRAAWAITLSIFGAATAIALVADSDSNRPTFKPNFGWLGEQWRLGRVFKVWCLLLALLIIAVLVFGVLCFVVDLPLPSLAVRIGKLLPFLLLGAGVGALVLRRLHWHVGNLGAYRIALPIVAALGFGAYVTYGFVPSLSKQLSAQEVYARYDSLADDADALAVYRTDERAARYYTSTEPELLRTQSQVIKYLQGSGRKWLALPVDEFVKVNVAYRTATKGQLFVVQTQSKRTTLLANQSVDGVENANFMTKAVLSEPPAIQFPVNANFEDKIELLGYNFELPQGETVGAGQRFKVQWIWRCLKSSPGSQKVFLHIDGHGKRLGGDHTPVDGKLPLQHWKKGDVIVDEQELKVPADFPPGEYAMMIGLYSGSNRLKVKDKDKHDGENRVRAGMLRVR